MVRCGFSSAQDREDPLGCVKSQAEEHGVARRANVLLLPDDGKSRTEAATVLYIDDDTVRCRHKQYLEGGRDFVVVNNRQGGMSRRSGRPEGGAEPVA